MPDERTPAPDSTAVRAALWRASHVELDSRPHVIEDQELMAYSHNFGLQRNPSSQTGQN